MIFQDNTQFCLLYSDHETITYPKQKELFMSELLPGKTKTSWAVNAPQLGESLETLNQALGSFSSNGQTWYGHAHL